MRAKANPDGAWVALERLRIERDWTYRELASFLGMPISTVHNAIHRGRADRTTTFKAQRFLALHRTSAA